jgi:hypothetical protein
MLVNFKSRFRYMRAFYSFSALLKFFIIKKLKKIFFNAGGRDTGVGQLG